jgi:hypothetical protein
LTIPHGEWAVPHGEFAMHEDVFILKISDLRDTKEIIQAKKLFMTGAGIQSYFM